MNRNNRMFLLVGLVVTIAVAVVVAQFASSSPDGLEYVAEQQGFAETAEDHDLSEAPLAKDPWVSLPLHLAPRNSA